MHSGTGEVPEILNIAEICERYGWTYEEYMQQPSDFLEAIRIKISVENTIKKEKDKSPLPFQ